MTKIVIEIDGVEHILTIAQAEALFRELSTLFDKRNPLPFDPLFPYPPVTCGGDTP